MDAEQLGRLLAEGRAKIEPTTGAFARLFMRRPPVDVTQSAGWNRFFAEGAPEWNQPTLVSMDIAREHLDHPGRYARTPRADAPSILRGTAVLTLVCHSDAHEGLFDRLSAKLGESDRSTMTRPPIIVDRGHERRAISIPVWGESDSTQFLAARMRSGLAALRDELAAVAGVMKVSIGIDESEAMVMAHRSGAPRHAYADQAEHVDHDAHEDVAVIERPRH